MPVGLLLETLKTSIASIGAQCEGTKETDGRLLPVRNTEAAPQWAPQCRETLSPIDRGVRETARAHRDRSVAMSSASPKPASPKAAAITVENPLMDAPPLSAAAEEAKEEAEVETEEQFEQELQMAHTQAESPRVEGRRKERDMSEEERTHLEARFRSCFDAMDVNEDGVIMIDPDDEELVRDA